MPGVSWSVNPADRFTDESIYLARAGVTDGKVVMALLVTTSSSLRSFNELRIQLISADLPT